MPRYYRDGFEEGLGRGGGGGGGGRRRGGAHLPGRQAPANASPVSTTFILGCEQNGFRLSDRWVPASDDAWYGFALCSSSSMQEAIGAQYMQKHLPKLEPFLRRVVSTSLRFLDQLEKCLGCRVGKKSN